MERHRRELYEFAQMVAVGASTAVTGSPKPLQAVERALLGSTRAAATAIQAELQDRLKAFARSAGVKMQGSARKPMPGRGRP